MYQPRSRISKGALEGIREFLGARNNTVTLEQVAEIYPSLVWWAVEKGSRDDSWKSEARRWAHDHLQYLNRKGERVVLTDGKNYRLASVNV